jgi:hypothetical protein
MPDTFRTRTPLPALGMSSLVLGVIALLLAFLPILGIPLSLCGILLGVVGIFSSLAVAGTYLRWSLAGLATSCLALIVNLAITYAPTGYLPEQNVPRTWQPVPDRPYAPPPASQK